MKKCDCGNKVEDWQDYCDDCSPVTCISPNDFDEIMETARKASKKFNCKVEGLNVGMDWSSIRFFLNQKNRVLLFINKVKT